jgi:hypothetical protein
LDAEGGQFIEDFAGHQIITRGFHRREVFYYCLHLGSFEALIRGSSWKEVRVSSRRESDSDG